MGSNPTSGTDRDVRYGPILLGWGDMSAHSRSEATSLSTVLVVLVLSVTSPLGAQEPAGKDATGMAWLTGGLGRGSEGIAAVAGADLSWEHHLVSFRTAATGPLFNGGQTYWDAGLLYGRALRWPDGLVAASAGIGVMGGSRTDDHPSIPLAVRMSWHQTTWLGLGAYAFLNFNEEQSFGGVTLTVELGLLR